MSKPIRNAIESAPGPTSERFADWQTMIGLLEAGQFDRAAQVLQEFQANNQFADQAGDGHLVAAAYQVCLACCQCQRELEWHRVAYQESLNRAGELKGQLEALLDEIAKIQHTLDGPGVGKTTITKLPLKVPGQALAGEIPAWRQRLQGAIAFLKGAKYLVNPPSTSSAASMALPPIPADESLGTHQDAQGAPISTIQFEAVPAPIGEAVVLEDQPRQSMEVYCLGTFRIFQGDGWIETWSSRKAQLVFKYLLVSRPTFISRDILMDTFWRDSDPEAARRNLHQAIYALRQTLKTNSTTIQHILFENDAYGLNPALIMWVDFEEFKQRVHHGQQLENENQLEQAVNEYVIAESLFQGDFMADDIYEDWLQVQRQNMFQMYISAASFLTKYHLTRNEFTSASTICQRILSMDYCQEAAHRNLMRCFSHMGQRNLAVRQYKLCARALKEELDIQPSEETHTLYRELIQGGKLLTH